MDAEREQLIAELTQLLAHERSREIYLRRDNAGLARVVARLRNNRELVRRIGRMAVAGSDLRIVSDGDEAGDES